MHVFTIPVEEAVKFAIVLTRVSGIMIIAPFFGSTSVPVQVKIALSCAISVLLYSSLPFHPSAYKIDQVSLVVLLFSELSIGVLIGLIARIFFSAFEMVGQFLSFQVGFSMINIIDPQSAVQSTVLSVTELLVGLMVFLGFDGHHRLLKAIAESFGFLAPLSFHLDGRIVDILIKSSGTIFAIGMQLAAPVLVVLIMTDIVFGIVGRVASQIQILIIGLPLKSGLGFFCLGLSFYLFPSVVERYLLQMYKEINTALRLLAN